MAKSYSFWIKCGLAALLIGLCDQLILGSEQLGAGFGLCALAGVAAIAAARPKLRPPAMTWAALVVAAVLALLEIDNGGYLTFLLFPVAVAVAALAPRAAARDDAWRWLQRVVMAGILAVWGPIGDLRRLLTIRARHTPLKLAALAMAAIMPVVGGMTFLWLFAIANPVIETTLLHIDLGQPDIGRIAFAGFVGVSAWGVLRPRGLRRTWKGPAWKGGDWPGVTVASVTVSLVVFNVLFALQNGLDIVFLWSGARLPGHLTMADYAHRGAYPLIVTALLAGLFVMAFLRPGTAIGQARPARVLVTLWVGQNLLLVASSLWRTMNYVQSYSLTEVRIAAMVWMVLVGVGLALILWRLLAGKSASWLINANVLAAGAVLLVSCAVDYGEIAAGWNLTHAKEVGGRGVELDTCYLETLGGSALVPLAELEHRGLPEAIQPKVVITRHLILEEMQVGQSKWRGWRFRDDRRIAKMRAILGGGGQPIPFGFTDDCRAQPLDSAQLTSTAQPGH